MIIKPLSVRRLEIANSITSAYSFYYIVADAILRGRPLSVVRMGDGEATILDTYSRIKPNSNDEVNVMTPAWRAQFGIVGMTWDALVSRLQVAASESDYFAPNVNGLTWGSYDLFDQALLWKPRPMVDNFFVNIWTTEMQAALYRAAGHILFIHRNRGTADAIQKRCKEYLGVRLDYLQLDNWKDALGVIEKAQKSEAKLVLFSGGPANKWIAPRIARPSNSFGPVFPKVVLDIGQTMDKWLLPLKDDPRLRDAIEVQRQ
jgi:hypothetical protein